MNKLKRFLTLRAALSMVFVTVLAGAASGQKTTETKETDANKTATVNLANPQTVNAQQSGAWTVGIDPSKNTVQLPNTPANPLSVKVENTPARKPFQARVSVGPAGNGFSSATLAIPAGKRLTIENVSVISRVPEGFRAEVNFFSYLDNDGDGVGGIEDIVFHRIALLDQGVFDGTAISVFNQKMLVFADERIGNDHYVVVAQARLNALLPTNAFAQVQFTFSGYVEDLPTAQ
jgi:hypothetical protein